LGGLGASGLPLVGMFVMWRGLVPVGGPREVFLSNGLSFNPASVTLYITQLFTYLFPLLMLFHRSWVGRTRGWWRFVGGVSLVYWLVPVRPASTQAAAGAYTVGLLNRTIRATIGRLGSAAEDIFFWVAFGLGIAVLFALVRDLVSRRSVAWPDARTFLGCA